MNAIQNVAMAAPTATSSPKRSKDLDDGLNDRGKANVANSQKEDARLTVKIKRQNTMLWIFGVLFLIVLAIGMAIGIHFNEALLTNTRGELTAGDWWLRVVGASAFELSMIAVGTYFVHVGLNSAMPWSKRIFGLLIGALLLAMIFFAIASIGYAKFNTLFDFLWQGANTSNTAANSSFDPSVAVAALPDIPLAVRLASAAPFIGVALLAAALEILWFETKKNKASAEALHAQHRDVLAIFARITSNKAKYAEKQNEREMLLKPEYQNAKAHADVFGYLEKERQKTLDSRPDPVNAAYIEKAQYDRIQDDDRHRTVRLQSIDALLARGGEITAHVNSIFPLGKPNFVTP